MQVHETMACAPAKRHIHVAIAIDDPKKVAAQRVNYLICLTIVTFLKVLNEYI